MPGPIRRLVVMCWRVSPCSASPWCSWRRPRPAPEARGRRLGHRRRHLHHLGVVPERQLLCRRRRGRQRPHLQRVLVVVALGHRRKQFSPRCRARAPASAPPSTRTATPSPTTGPRGRRPRTSTEAILTSVSCPSADFCVAVDGEGNALTYNGSSWSSPSDIDGSNVLVGVVPERHLLRRCR
jgi:hypothetical protein